MIHYGKKALFVHMPKTGGSWVRSVLVDSGGKEISYAHDVVKNHKLNIFLKRLVPFCFVRHPLMILYSMWRHWAGDPSCRVNNSNGQLDFMWDKKEYGWILTQCIDEKSINKTVENFLTFQPGFITWMMGRYVNGCKYIGRYESIENDLIKILLEINGNIDINLKNNIFAAARVNESYGIRQKLEKQLVEDFLTAETACKKYSYTYEDIDRLGLIG